MVEWKIGKLRIRNLEIITFCILALIYSLVIFLEEGTLLYDWISLISEKVRDLSTGSVNAYIISFLICVGGNSTVLIVVPYVYVIYYLSFYNPGIWIWIGLVSGIGAALGEIVSYYAGRWIGSSKKVKKSDIGEKFQRMQVQFEKNPKIVPWFVFFFALTPLPDDMILVPLGMMKYDYKRTVIPSIIGKTILTTFMCWLGYLAGTVISDWELLYAEYPWTSPLRLIIPTESVNPRMDLITFSFVFIFIYLIARVNFRGLIKRVNRDRKHFQQYLIKGKKYTIDELIEEFTIINTEKFKDYMKELSEIYPNIRMDQEKITLDAISDHKLAYKQSLRWIDFFYLHETAKPTLSKEEAKKVKKETKIAKREAKKEAKLAKKEMKLAKKEAEKEASQLEENDEFSKIKPEEEKQNGSNTETESQEVEDK
jgi:membrane protein DedA with SNARE-associated domain